MNFVVDILERLCVSNVKMNPCKKLEGDSIKERYI